MGKTSQQKAYDFGVDCGLNGPNETNAHFSIFSDPEHTKQWELGKTYGEKLKKFKTWTPLSNNDNKKTRIIEEFAILSLLKRVDAIRRDHGAYIWAFPIKWRNQTTGQTEKVRFGWEIEYENGWCISVGYQSRNFETYFKALEDSVGFFNTNKEGNRAILPALG